MSKDVQSKSELHSLAKLQSSAPAAFRTVMTILDDWGFTDQEMACSLGIDLTQLKAYRDQELVSADVDEDLILRLSYILGIYKALRILVYKPDVIRQWINTPSKTGFFSRAAPRDLMKTGSMESLRRTRQYLDSYLTDSFG